MKITKEIKSAIQHSVKAEGSNAAFANKVGVDKCSIGRILKGEVTKLSLKSWLKIKPNIDLSRVKVADEPKIDPAILQALDRRYRFRGKISLGFLPEVRDRLSISQIELAALSGVHQRTLLMIEQEKRSPNPREIANIAKALGLTPEMILNPPSIDSLCKMVKKAEVPVEFSELARVRELPAEFRKLIKTLCQIDSDARQRVFKLAESFLPNDGIQKP